MATALVDNATLIPARSGDDTADCKDHECANRVVLSADRSLFNLASGDTSLHVGFLTPAEADEALQNLSKENGEIEYQQWYHMPARSGKQRYKELQKLRRLKRALANPRPDGTVPHYRFPVNDQQRYGVQTPMSPTVEKIRAKVEALTGIAYNHSVVLLYRDGDDCIGFHKDKLLDLDENSPIASISLGVARPYVLRDNHLNPTKEIEFELPHGALLLLGAQSNVEYYHAVRKLDDEEAAMKKGVRVSITFRKVDTYRHPETGVLMGKGADYASLNWPDELNGEHRLHDNLEESVQPSSPVETTSLS